MEVMNINRFIGPVIAHIGALLWENGGYTGDERYEDLKVTGKLGYKMFTNGLRMIGTTTDDIENMLK